MGLDHVALALICYIFTSPNCVLARFTVLTQDSPVVAAIGDVAVFNCRTSIICELVEVRWIRIKDGRNSTINLFQNGSDLQACELPEYIGRTELVREGLADGRASLKLFNVSVADKGIYHCLLETEHYFDIGGAELRVTALGSEPRIDFERLQNGAIRTVCRSAGWYPEPTVVKEDDDGEMKIQQEANGLYGIEYSRVIIKNSNRNFFCSIYTLFPHQAREKSLYVTDGLFQRTYSRVETTIFPVLFAGLLLLFLLIHVLALLIVTISAQQRKKQGPCPQRGPAYY